MILVTGGSFQGKTYYVTETFGIEYEDMTDGAECAFEDIFQAKALNHFHEYVRRALKEGIDVGGLAGELIKRNPDIVIISNELGSGVVPVDASDREWRETTGRLCCGIAREAAQVHRVVCGIGTVIKGG